MHIAKYNNNKTIVEIIGSNLKIDNFQSIYGVVFFFILVTLQFQGLVAMGYID